MNARLAWTSVGTAVTIGPLLRHESPEEDLVQQARRDRGQQQSDAPLQSHCGADDATATERRPHHGGCHCFRICSGELRLIVAAVVFAGSGQRVLSDWRSHKARIDLCNGGAFRPQAPGESAQPVLCGRVGGP